MGQINLFENEKPCSQERRHDHHRDHDAIDTDAGRLHGHDFVVALQDAERDQHCQKHAEVQVVVEKVRRHIGQVRADHERGDMVAQNVVQQLEECEHQSENHEAGDDQAQIAEEVFEHVVVEQHGEVQTEESGPCFGAAVGAGIIGNADRAGSRGPDLLAQPFPKTAQHANVDGPFFYAVQESGASSQENKIGQPGSERNRDFAFLGERDSDEGKRVVGKHEDDGENESAGLAALFGGEAERNANQREHEAGGGQGEAAVELQCGPACVEAACARALPKDHGVHGANRRLAFGRVAIGCGDVEGDVGALECGNLVVIHGSRIGFMGGAVGEVQAERVRSGADQQALTRQGNAGSGGIGEIGEEDALPDGCALCVHYVLHVQDCFGKAFIKHARLHFE